MSSVKIKKIKFFFDDADCVFFVVLLENIRVAVSRALFMRFLFFSIQFNSIHFISILFSVTKITKEKERKRNVTKLTKYNEINEINEKKHHENIIFYIKTVYFFIHLNNETVVFLFFSSVSFFSFLFVICELRFFLVKKL